MQDININNYGRATEFDINNIAEYLLMEALSSINKVGKVADGQMWVFIVTPKGFEVIMGSHYDLMEIFKLVRQHSGQTLLRAFNFYNNLSSGIWEISIMQPIDGEDEANHILTAKVNVDRRPFTLDITSVRGCRF